MLLFSGALVVRVVVLLWTVDAPGDGPSRALAAFHWAGSPSFPTWGVWPPGFLLLSGCAEALVGDPRISARLLNVLLGSLTVPLLYLLARRLYGWSVAVASGAALALLPLHVELSASSLSEPAFVVELVAGTLLLIGAPEGRPANHRRERLRVALGAACLVLAGMTRYEAWPLVPLFVVHRFVQARSLRAAATLGAALLAFPAAWTIGNWLHTGNPLFGISAATAYIDIPRDPASLSRAFELLASWTDEQLGWVPVSAVLLGAGVELVRIVRGRSDAARIFYLTIAGMQWLVLLRFTMVRGEAVWSRYLLASLTFGLPLAFVPWAGGRRAAAAGGPLPDEAQPRRALALAALAVLSLSLTWLGYGEKVAGHWVTSRRPVSVYALVDWLRASGRVGEPLLLTPMDWEATYLPLEVPEVAGRSLIVSPWIGDETLREWSTRFRPTLLVTRPGDEGQAARVEAALGVALRDAPVVFRHQALEVHDLRRASR